MQNNVEQGDSHLDGACIAAIVLIFDTYDSVRYLMSYLRVQTVVKQIEVIFVVDSRRQIKMDESELTCFHSWHIVEVEKLISIAQGYAAGICQAHAPVVALTQDHAFPDNKWAELFIIAHREHWVAVGPSMRNANPDTMVSWADFYLSYGEWAYPSLSGSVRHLPGHNSSYKRHILLMYKDRLEDMLEAESVFHRDLRAKGYELFLEANSCTAHLNYALWSSWMRKRYCQGRQFAATWAKPWHWLHRLLFAIVSPVIPWVRLVHIQKHVRRGKPFYFFLRLLPLLLLGLVAESCGHMTGWVAGIGDCMEKVVQYEFDRVKHAELVRYKKGCKSTMDWRYVESSPSYLKGSFNENK